MKKGGRIRWLVIVVWGGALALALIISRIWHLNFWIVFGIVALSLVINGFIAEIEDRSPGGFFYPTKKKKT